MKKIDDEEIESCPVCNIYLGIAPEEKLRPDNNIQALRKRLFPLKRAEFDASNFPTVTLPLKGKQRSLSSLVVETPKVAAQPVLTGKRTKATRTTFRATSSLSNNGTVKLLITEGHDHETGKISASKSTKMTTSAIKKQIKSDIVASSQPCPQDRKNSKTMDMEELCKPLSSFLEASGTKSLRSNLKSHAAAAKEDKIKSTNGKVTITETRVREASREKSLKLGPKSHAAATKEDKIKSTKSEQVANTGTSVGSHSNKLTLRKEKNGNSDNLWKNPEGDYGQVLLGSTSTVYLHDGITTPVWFSLVTSPHQSEKLLPQIPNAYLRIKDGTLQVFSIQRYIMQKLELASDDEVEILCHGMPICPLMMLKDLLELWLSRQPQHEVQVPVGAPAKQFVMVLGYRRRS